MDGRREGKSFSFICSVAVDDDTAAAVLGRV